MHKRRLTIIITALILAALVGAGVACRKSSFSAQGYRYGRYGPIHVLGKLWVDSDTNLDGALDVDGTTNLDDLDIDLSSELEIDGALTDFGGGSCSVADGDNDVCIAAVLEVDGELELDGALDADSTADIADTLTLSKASGNGLVVTANIDANGDLDVDGTTNLDMVDIDGAVDFGGQELDLDADNDTSITASTDDQIDIEISGADDFQFTANTFTLRAGSKMIPENATNAGPMFSASASHTHAVTETAVTMFVIPANANVIDVIYTVDTQWNDGTSAAVNCGISGGDIDAFVANMNVNDAADFNRLGDAADMPYATSLVDVGGADATVVCQVAEGTNNASAGEATLYISYMID